MDRWRTLTFLFGGLWALTALSLGATLWLRPAPVAPAVDPVAAPSHSVATPATPRSQPGETLGTASPGVAVAITDGGEPAWLSDPAAPLPEAVMDRAREQLRAERDDRRDERHDEMSDELEAFVEDEGLSADKAEKLRDTIEGFRDKMDAMRDSMRSGDADFREVRETMRDAREQLGADIEAQLGEDGAERFREAVFGGPGGPGGGFGPPRRPPPL